MLKTASLRPTRSAQTAKTAFLAVLGSEIIFFGTLVMAFIYMRTDTTTWQGASYSLSRLLLPGGNTILLLVSAVTMALGLRSIRQGKPAALRNWTVVTLVLGLVFIAGQALEFSSAGMKINDQAFGGVFFTLMGFHAVHVLAGILMLVAVLWRNALGDFNVRRHVAVQIGTWFWYFVTAVWVVLFTALYLV